MGAEEQQGKEDSYIRQASGLWTASSAGELEGFVLVPKTWASLECITHLPSALAVKAQNSPILTEKGSCLL